MDAVFVLSVIFGAIVAIVYLSIRRKERMALLQSGRDASFFDTGKKCFSSLKWGLLLFFVGIGLLVAEILIRRDLMSEEAAYFSLAFISGGFALLLDFMIERSKMKQEQNENAGEGKV